jgi:hypothetical protein
MWAKRQRKPNFQSLVGTWIFTSTFLALGIYETLMEWIAIET